MLRLAAFNVENLFERAAAFNLADPDEGKAVSLAHARANALFAKPRYAAADRRAMLGLLDTLGLAKSDRSKVAILRQNRGKLRDGSGAITARGRADWVGQVDLLAEPVNAEAIANTGRVIQKVAADVLALVEAESRPALVRFVAQVLERAPDYAHAMLVDGNDERGIDVGLLARRGLEICEMRSHVDARENGCDPVFARDCPEYEVRVGGGKSLWVIPNHFSSKRGGAAADRRRTAQAERAAAIYRERRKRGAELVAVVGDLNDEPRRPVLDALLRRTDLKDVSELPAFESDGLPGTYGPGTLGTKIDYILLSPALRALARRGGVERSGVFDKRATPRWEMLPGLTEATAASDHAAIWVDLDL
jgi:endonuclease/exonuclease/phosphatase family metal-dependent hydrolase